MPHFSIELTDEQFRSVHTLATKRRMKPNAVIQQAIATEILLAEHMKPGDELLIKSGGTFQKVIFAKGAVK